MGGGFPQREINVTVSGEKALPCALGAFACFVWLAFRVWWPRPIEFPEVMLSSGITYCSIVIGFLGTTVAIMASMPAASAIVRIREEGYGHVLRWYLSETVLWGLIATVVGFVGFTPLSSCAIYQATWLLTMVASFVALARIAIVFFHVLRGVWD